jgi:hypothetical protein
MTSLSILDYLPLVRSLMYHPFPFMGNLISWEDKGQKFLPVRLSTPKIGLTFSIMTVHVALVSFRIFDVVMFDSKNDGGWKGNTTSLSIYTGIITAWALGCAGFKHSERIASWYNSLIHDQKKTNGQNMIGKTGPSVTKLDLKVFFYEVCQTVKDMRSGKVMRVVLTMGLMSQMAIPALSFLFLLYAPCSLPVFIRSSLSDCPRIGGFPQMTSTLLAKFSWTLLDTVLLDYVFRQGIFVIVFSIYMGAICIRDRIEGSVKSNVLFRK